MAVHCIFGPPGTGKTRELVRIAEDEALKRNRVMFLSFTKAAAQEAAGRVESDGTIQASTIHSVAYRILGLTKQQVVDSQKMQEFSAHAGVPLRGPDEDTLQVGDEYIDVISFAANRMIDIGEAYEIFNRPGQPREFENFYNSYTEWKDTFGYLDFDDMLLRLKEKADKLAGPPVIILDEAQDCSPLQWAVFGGLIRKALRVYIAGDDDQAIFEWSGADPHAMVDFASKHSANVRVLGQSHRIPKSVHEFVHEKILPQFEKRQPKTYKPRKGGLDRGVLRWGSVHDFPFDMFALPHEGTTMILVRDKFRSDDVQRILNAQLIPYRVAGGSSPFDNRRARAIRACLKLNMGEPPVENEWDALAYLTRAKKGDPSVALGKHWSQVVPLSQSQKDFYNQIDLLKPIDTTVSTIHQAKGREADHVILNLELTDRVILNAETNRDAELRVMYVACTRAKQRLDLCAENLLI